MCPRLSFGGNGGRWGRRPRREQKGGGNTRAKGSLPGNHLWWKGGEIPSPRSATRHIFQQCLFSLPCGKAHVCPLKLTAQETERPWERTSLTTSCFNFLKDWKWGKRMPGKNQSRCSLSWQILCLFKNVPLLCCRYCPWAQENSLLPGIFSCSWVTGTPTISKPDFSRSSSFS